MSDIESTKVYLPKSLIFPVTIIKIHVEENQEIKKYDPILTYKYYDYEPIPISEQDEDQTDEAERPLKKVEYVGTYESNVNGSIFKVLVKVGDVIQDNSKSIIEVIEPCAHPIQYGGLCAVCGKSLEDEDDEKRTPISMTHGSTNLKVSSKEAIDIEKSSTDRLFKEKKLSLVVDLDQTVIHVTVDPTVAEWMSDPTNPNYDAVKDVKPFILEEPPFVPPGYSGPKLPPTKRWYYVKLRPGLHEFLEKMNERYEMHIYTMATRAYAENIAKIIDPDGIYFGDRILSRDESGSLTQKSLKRLFPVDTSMVVIIDDRGDVWNWSPHLIKVVPYDFFLGIGDINSSFLPRQQTMLGPSKRRKSVSILEETVLNEEIRKSDDIENENAIDDSDSEENGMTTGSPDSQVVSEAASDSTSPVDRLVELNESDDTGLFAVQEIERSTTLEHQEHDRPLAKLQENLDKIIEKETEVSSSDPESSKSSIRESNSPAEVKETHNLLYDDDKELTFLGQALVRIHNEYYFETENLKDKNTIIDVKDIMNEMKSIVFNGCVILLSGILPLGTKLQNADIVIWARSFGATFVENYSTKVTHVICKNAGTFKVRLAKSVDPNVKVVNPDWLFACMSLWDRVSEDEYEMKVDHLLSKSQVDDFLEFHGQNNGESLDWSEIDDEIKEFMGSDYEDDDDDDDNDDDDHDDHDDGDDDEEEKNGSEDDEDRDAAAGGDNGEDDADGKNADQDKYNGSNEFFKGKNDKEFHDDQDKKRLSDNGIGSLKHKKQKMETYHSKDEDEDSDDEFERDLLDHLADLDQ